MNEQLDSNGAGAPHDPFDPAALRLSQDFTSQVAVKKVVVSVPVRKPQREVFVRVHPTEAINVYTLEYEREVYLVRPELVAATGLAARPTQIFTAVTRSGDPFLWPVTLPGPDGRQNPWHESLMAAAEQAKRAWIRVQANIQAGAYDVLVAQGTLPDPIWPDVSQRDLLRLGFGGGRLIEDAGHPVLRKLRGEM